LAISSRTARKAAGPSDITFVFAVVADAIEAIHSGSESGFVLAQVADIVLPLRARVGMSVLKHGEVVEDAAVDRAKGIVGGSLHAATIVVVALAQ
jgi:hypothetical protein